jgi:hypothetical protein
MKMQTRDLLLDSEVALRLVGVAVEDELRGLHGEVLEAPRLRLVQIGTRGFHDSGAIPDAVSRAYSEVAEAMLMLRSGRHALGGCTDAAAGGEASEPEAGTGRPETVGAGAEPGRAGASAQLGAALVLLDEMERRLLCLAGVLAPSTGIAPTWGAQGWPPTLTHAHSR